MSSVFKFVLYLGVAVGLLGFVIGSFQSEPIVEKAVAAVGSYALLRQILSFGGLGLIVIGLIGRSATRKTEVEWK
ncbi:MAG: hypothetical protein ACE37F_00290 [Nannocystaceae bacterium]|nr:hypothetical protein [bacterium]